MWAKFNFAKSCVLVIPILLILCIVWILRFEQYSFYPRVSLCKQELLRKYLALPNPTLSKQHEDNFSSTPYPRYALNCELLWSKNTSAGQYVFTDKFHNSVTAIPQEETLIYHTLWMGGFPFNPLGSLIDSFLVTQQLHRSKLIIWLYPSLVTDIDPQMKAYMKLPNQIFEVKVFNFSVEAPHFCEDQPDFLDYLLTLIEQKRKIQQFSDIARIILLNKYGGIWVDSDVILLRDLRPFVETFGDFAPSFWSVAWNNHVIALRKNGTNSNTLQEAICKFPFNSTIDQIIDKEPDKILNYWPLKPEFYPTEPFSHRLDFQWNDGIIKYCQAKKSCQLFPMHLGRFDPQWYFKNKKKNKKNSQMIRKKKLFERGCNSIFSCQEYPQFPKPPAFLKGVMTLHTRSAHR